MNDLPARLSELLSPTVKRWGGRLAWAWLGVVTVAAVVVLARRSHPVTPAFAAPVPDVATAIDLARYALGARLEVSSYHGPANHHPIFAIDGLGGGGSGGDGGARGVDALMKWVSAPSDRAPWLIVRWPWPVDLDEVRLVHAGRFEDGAYTIRDYTVSCLGPDDAPLAPPASVVVRDNRAPTSSHALTCSAVSALRIDFVVDDAKDSPRAVVRLYEIEALGRPHRPALPGPPGSKAVAP